jgi:predicted Rossmann fold nucleotide-binding protein DprA/Smf involved in DNA uptake
MTSAPSPNSQAILLLTAPLMAGRADPSGDLLSLGEYNRLARLLRENQWQPAELLGPGAKEILGRCRHVFDSARLDRLLGRGFLLSQAVDHWHARAIWVVSRADPEYPRRLKVRLKEDAPPVLYGCGDAALLETGGLAVVGSRHVDADLLAYTEDIGRLATGAKLTLVSGGARGIDRAAMRGALMADGRAVGVLSDDLERAALARDNREPLMDGKLTLISPYDPAVGFNVGHAMQRNKLIYGLADAALVISSDYEKGGTWAGAIEQLEKFRFGPVFVCTLGKLGKGNEALLRKGALPWPNPQNGEAFAKTLAMTASVTATPSEQNDLPLVLLEEVKQPVGAESKEQKATEELPAPPATATGEPAQALFSFVAELLRKALREPMTEAAVAELLHISKPQAKAWLGRMVEHGVVEKLSKPLRYRTSKADDRLF